MYQQVSEPFYSSIDAVSILNILDLGLEIWGLESTVNMIISFLRYKIIWFAYVIFFEFPRIKSCQIKKIQP